MKIGYLLQQEEDIFTPPYNGPANHVREVVKALVALGHEVQVLVVANGRIITADHHFQPQPVPPTWLDRGLPRLVERLVRRVQYELQLPYAALFESVRFALAARAVLADCDIFLERMSWVSYGAALASRRLKIPLVLENNGDHLADLEAKGLAPRGLQYHISLRGMGWAVRQAAHVVVSGDGWRDQFLARWQSDPAHVTTVENGTILVEMLARADLRSFGADDGADTAVTLVYLGGFTPWQGVPILLQAVAQARAHLPPLRLLLIGDGGGRAEAEQLTAELNLSDLVTFTGRLAPEAYAPLLAQADIGLAPYHNWPEFSGLKIFDYKATGLAVIASGENGRPATLRHRQSGWIVPPGDIEALAQAICHLAGDQSLRRHLGQTARHEAEIHHRWQHTAERLVDIFEMTIKSET
ncbi:MAG: glycosyltransferase family 4 protein [Chloroflexota bacterium]